MGHFNRLASLLMLLSAWSPSGAQDTAFTYQGELKRGGAPANGAYDFQVALFLQETAGTLIDLLAFEDVAVGEGLFSLALDFTAIPFENDQVWLEIRVRPGAETGNYTSLQPRQKLRATPYAIRAYQADDAALLNSNDAAFYRNASNIIAGTLAEARISPAIARDTEVFGLVAANDGAGSGLDGDLLDGQHAVDFAAAGHLHDERYFSETEADERFVNTAGGDTITFDSNTSPALTVVQSGTNDALRATTSSSNAGKAALHGIAGTPGANINAVAGVFGTSTDGMGVIGSSTNNAGVFGWSTSSSAVRGESQSTTEPAITGANYATTGTGIGVRGQSVYAGVWGESEGGYGVRGKSTYIGVYGSGGSLAGYFSGKVRVTSDLTVLGTLSKGAGSFKIDHPLDPENRYLFHSFVESPEMMNVYNGNVVLDDAGRAEVELPHYFEALNRDFRYQLTPIGGAAPDLHVATTITGNSFTIAGGAPGLQVSWQVTGVRQDPYALANPIEVEVDKPAREKGLYLHPEAYDQAAGTSGQERRGIDETLHPEPAGNEKDVAPRAAQR